MYKSLTALIFKNTVTAALLVLLTSPAFAGLVDFEDVTPENGSTNVVSTGFNFQSGFGGWLYTPPGGVVETGFSGNPHSSMRLAGSGDSGGGGKVDLPGPGVRMTKVGGGSFDVASFLAATFSTIQPTDVLTVQGSFAAGGTISTTFDISTSFASFTLSGFTGLDSIDFWSTAAAGFPLDGFQIDDISTDLVNVPEPAALGLLGLGIAGLGLSRRRRQKA